MSNGLILRSTVTGHNLIEVTAYNGINPAFGPTNLLDPQPKVVTQSQPAPGNNVLIIGLDLLSDQPVDTFAALYTNLSATASVAVFGAPESAGYSGIDASNANIILSGNIVPPTVAGTRPHLLVSGVRHVVRFLKIYLYDTPANLDNFIRCGVVMAGLSWQCANSQFNFELGAGRKIVDLSDKRQLPGGEVGRWAKAKVPAFRATWSNMTDVDLRALWAILSPVGYSEPLLLIEDPDPTAGLNERIHYCTIDSLDYYSRVQLDKSSIELKVTDWL